jgi:homoserine kinase
VQKIKIRLPATLTNFGPSLDNLSLAVGLYTHVELSPRSDQQLIVETEGEGAGQYALGLRHPVFLGISRFFQHMETTQLGIHIKIKNEIPINHGLGAETAFMVAGIIGANNLMGNIYNRDQLIPLSAKLVTHQDGAIASFIGGLATSIKVDNHIIYRALPITPFRLILAIPKIKKFKVDNSPDLVAMKDMRHNLRQTAMLQQAFAEGDLELLVQTLEDPIDQPLIQAGISGFAHVAEIARLAGALGVTTTGRGSTMVFFAHDNLPHLVEVINQAFLNLDITAQVLTVPVDTQGVVLSVMKSI